MADEILEAMNDRRKSIRKSIRYNELDCEIKQKRDQAKEDGLNKECENLERMHNIDSKIMHREVKKVNDFTSQSRQARTNFANTFRTLPHC